MAALAKAVNYKAAKSGAIFTVSDGVDNASKSYYSTLQTGTSVEARPINERPAAKPEGGSVSSADGALRQIDEQSVTFSSLKVTPAEGGEISQDMLDLIRSFKPTEEDKKIVFLDFEPRQSSIMLHRERVMALARMGYTLQAIRMMVDSKGTKVVQDQDARAAVAGIPKRKFALVLCDSALTHRETEYSGLLRELFTSKCVISKAMLDLVPSYIGTANISGVSPTPDQTQRGRQRYLEATANYMRPLFNNEAFRNLIAQQRSANAAKGSVPKAN